MRIVVLVTLLLGAHFALTVFVPGSKALFYWPWGQDSRPLRTGLGGLPGRSGGLVTVVLAAVAGLGFLAAAASLMGIGVPADRWTWLVIVAGAASLIQFGLHFSLMALLPIAVDVVLLVGVLGLGWTVSGLTGS